MLKKFLNVFVFVLLVLSIRPAAANVSLLIYGDSLSAGYGMPEADTWVAEIDRQWQENYPDLNIINASISGETTSGGRDRLPDVLDRHFPDLVFIELGGNDGLRGYNLDRLADNLHAMIDAARERHICVALSEVEIPPNMGRRYAERFQQVFHDVAAARDIPLVPFFMRDIATDSSLMQNDGIHPNEAAQPVIAEMMEPKLRALLDDCTGI